jgi:4-hydroxythreonine-4-phosphate dehydrogenase
MEKRMLDFCTPIIFGSAKLITAYKKNMDINLLFNGIRQADSAIPGKLNVLNLWKDEIEVHLGKPTAESGKHAFESLEAATNALAKGEIDLLVTAPINKENIQSEEFKFAGHTEYLESKLKGESLMILMADSLRIGLITGHIPVSKVSETINPELIKKKVAILHKTLVQDFGISKPKIAILGLNPHCGEGVNFTAGLDKVRTSPDHGTAYDIAGKDLANINSFKEAVFSGIQIFKTRQEYKSLTENALKSTHQKENR